MVTIALTHVLQEGPLPQHLVSLGATFCVDQCQSDWVGSYFLHQSQVLMSVHFEKKKFASRGPPYCTCATEVDFTAMKKPQSLLYDARSIARTPVFVHIELRASPTQGVENVSQHVKKASPC